MIEIRIRYGYDIASVKDHEHIRRSSRVKTKEMQLTDEMKVTIKREEYLSNSKNKTLLISKLKHHLEYDSQEVTVSRADADTVIVKVALKVRFYTFIHYINPLMFFRKLKML